MNSTRAYNFQTKLASSFFKNRTGKVNYAIFSAMPEELDSVKIKFENSHSEKIKIGEFEFLIYTYNDTKILLASLGLGTVFAATLLTFVYNNFHPEIVLFTGVAGGINPKVKIRDVIIVEHAFEAELRGSMEALRNTPFETALKHPQKNNSFPSTFSCNFDLLNIVKKMAFPSDVTVHFGGVVTSNKFPAPVELFDEIKQMQSMSIDMETSALYQAAWLLNIPILAIRGISNLLNHQGIDEDISVSDLRGSAEAAGNILFSILNKFILEFNSQNKVTNQSNEINLLINRFNLKPHPEGGYYARIFESTIEMKAFDSDRYENESRKAGTAIYYLLRGDDFSAFHILKSDEIWHYYEGSPIILHVIDRDGNYTSQKLGNPSVDAEASFQINIPAGNWFAAEVIDKSCFSFVGCTVSPGFEFKDFELGDRNTLNTLFPRHENIINRFTRVGLDDEANRLEPSMKLIKS